MLKKTLALVIAVISAISMNAQTPISFGYRGDQGSYSYNFTQTWTNGEITLEPQDDYARLSIANNTEIANLSNYDLVVDVESLNGNYQITWLENSTEKYSGNLHSGINNISIKGTNISEVHLLGPNNGQRGAIKIKSIKINNVQTTYAFKYNFLTFASNITMDNGQWAEVYLKGVTDFKPLYLTFNTTRISSGLQLVIKTNSGERTENFDTSKSTQTFNCGRNIKEISIKTTSDSGERYIDITSITADTKQNSSGSGGGGGSIANLNLTDRDVVWTFTQEDANNDANHMTFASLDENKKFTDVSTGNRHLKYIGHSEDAVSNVVQGKLSTLNISSATTKKGELPAEGFFEIVPNTSQGYIQIDGTGTQNYVILKQDGTQVGSYSLNNSNWVSFPNYNQPYYICFNEAVGISRIRLKDNNLIPTITDNLEEVYNVSPGHTIEMPLTVANSDHMNFQWYKNTIRSVVGATAISGATKSYYYGQSNASGQTEYFFCVVSGKYNPAQRFSNIAIVTATQTSAPSAPDIYYEYTTDGTILACYNNGNYAPITFTFDGSDPRTSETATTLHPYDGVHTYGSINLKEETVVKAYCPKGTYTGATYKKDSYVVTKTIPVLGAGKAIVSWKHMNTYLNTNENVLKMEVLSSTLDLAKAQDFNCRNLMMTKMVADEKKTAENPDKITFKISFLQNQGYGYFDPEEVAFRINRINKGHGKVKFSLKLKNSADEIQKYSYNNQTIDCNVEQDISDIIVDKDKGWTDFFSPIIRIDNWKSSWRLEAGYYIEFSIMAWGLEPGEGIGLASITAYGGVSDAHSDLTITNERKFSIPVGGEHVIQLTSGSTGDYTVTSSDNTVISLSDYSGTNGLGNRQGTITVKGLKAGTSTIHIRQAASNVSGLSYKDQDITLNAIVTANGNVTFYPVSGDVACESISENDLVQYGAWLKYEGTTGYTNQIAVNHIDPATDANTHTEKSINLALLAANSKTTLDLYVKNARSVTVYARHGNNSNAQLKIEAYNHNSDGSYTLDETTTFNSLIAGLKGNMCSLNLNDNGEHRIRITNPDTDNKNIYVYAVKLSDKKVSDFALKTTEKTLSLGGDNNWTPASGTDYSNTNGGAVSISIPEGDPYVALNANATTVSGCAAGSTFLHLKQAATNEYRATSRSVDITVTRGAEIITEGKKTWDLTTSDLSKTDVLDGLYWDARYGAVDDRTLDGSIYTRLNGLLINKQSEAHFNLPDSHKGGVVSITYGPRLKHTTTSLRINDKYPKTVLIDDEWIKTKQQSWTINPSVKTVSISMGADFNDGVITSISWAPTQATCTFPTAKDHGSTDQNFSIQKTDNGTDTVPDMIDLSGDQYKDWTLAGNQVYQILLAKTYKITVPDDKCVKKIVIRGTSFDEYDASVITVENCKAESGQSLAGHSEEVTYLEYVPTKQVGQYIITVAQQTAIVGIDVYTYDICRASKLTETDVTNGATRLGTICYEKDVHGRNHYGALFYRILYKRKDADTNKEYVVFEEVADMEKGYPYIFIANDTKVGLDFTSDDAATTSTSENGLYGVMLSESFTFTVDNCNEELNTAGSDMNGYFGISGNGIKIITPTAEKPVTISGNKAFIKLSEVPTAPQQNSAPARRVCVGSDGFGFEYPEEDEESETEDPDEDDVTSSTVIECLSPVNKGIYNLNGQQMVGISKGMYIHNGKIIIVR